MIANGPFPARLLASALKTTQCVTLHFVGRAEIRSRGTIGALWYHTLIGYSGGREHRGGDLGSFGEAIRREAQEL
jgi:hypothetical protein